MSNEKGFVQELSETARKKGKDTTLKSVARIHVYRCLYSPPLKDFAIFAAKKSACMYVCV